MRKRMTHLALMAATVLLGLTACSEESIVTAPAEPQNPPVADDNSGNVYITGDDFTWELGDEGDGNDGNGGNGGSDGGDASSIRPVTRTALTIDGNTARFTWTPGDRVGILPDEGAQVWFEIPTPAEGEEPTATATFDGGAWALKPTSDYAAYYPFVKDFDLDRTRVPVSYTGQKQVGNSTTAHLGAYDYQGARPSTTNASGGVSFDFDHVGALVLLQFTVPEAGTQLTGVTLSADGAEFTTEGTYDLTSTTGFPITPTATATSMTIGLDHTTTVADEAVTLYFMCAPIDLSGKPVSVSVACGTEGETLKLYADGKNLQAAGGYLMEAKVLIDLSQYEDGTTVNITEDSRIIGDGTEFNVTLNIADDATVIFEVGTSGVNLGGSITVADGKTLTLLATGNAEYTVKGGISLGNSANVIIEGDLTQENNKLTVTSSGGNAGIGANGGVTAGDITIRNARVDATGSCSSDSNLSGAGIGTAKANMGNILIENSIVTAAGGYDAVNSFSDAYSHAAAIGMGSFGVTMGNITLINSEITASNNGDGYASVIGAGSFCYSAGSISDDNSGNMGDIIITNTKLNLSMAKGEYFNYASMIGPGRGNNANYVNMGKIIFTDVTQAELDEMIELWSIPSDFNEWGGCVLGKGYDGIESHNGDFGGVWVSDGNGGTVQIGDENGYYDPE